MCAGFEWSQEASYESRFFCDLAPNSYHITAILMSLAGLPDGRQRERAQRSHGQGMWSDRTTIPSKWLCRVVCSGVLNFVLSYHSHFDEFGLRYEQQHTATRAGGSTSLVCDTLARWDASQSGCDMWFSGFISQPALKSDPMAKSAITMAIRTIIFLLTPELIFGILKGRGRC